jgi:hypothetical protein
MKRTLFGVITLGLLAMAIAATAQPAKHHAKRARTLAASAAICSDPSHCPIGGCSTISAMTAMATSGQIKANAGVCSGTDPSKCPASCRKAAASAAAEQTASR